ncbi:BAG family molecular chaperone regulator 7 isoform X1 [Arachis duranensis]|uniref:BAG family molecular chaperone regulator 7 isoform X1 n=1 Tax=Arachis duranensis TaxID=130453 RepID=A0A6P4DTZ6_ARADU|nr:BAG family molecular chaperone regulator 7 isoform X1 [Arachis duranensis]XP_025687149.1 BAG family molecular chaperone regulator 7 isoform X1 [Arachis hypogaea]
MSRFRRFELIEEQPFCYYSNTFSSSSPPSSLPLFFAETSSIVVPTRTLTFPSFVEDSLCFDLFEDTVDSVADLIVPPHSAAIALRRVKHRVEKQLETELFLQNLSDRVSELEYRFDRVLAAKRCGGVGGVGDRKYTWTAEIKGAERNGFDRKYKWVAEIVEEEKRKAAAARNIKWTAEIKGKGEESGNTRKYTFEVESADAEKKKKKKEKEKETEHEKKKKGSALRIVEIEEPSDHRTLVLRQKAGTSNYNSNSKAFAKRFGAVQNNRGKRKELSPQDAAMLIQISFRTYLIRRSKALRALRELAVAKSKLKEIRAQFNNFSYRRHLSRDAEERQRFSEKIIVLLLTVDAIEGVDRMVRYAKRSIVDELEAMLDVVDPQPGGRSRSFRRTFDMPDGVIRKEIEEGVRQVVQMLDDAENSSSTFEACL